LVGIRTDGSEHVWTDFYLEKYGWIPVDATYKNSNKNGDFFGRVSVKDVPVILSFGVDLTINGIDQNQTVPKKIEILQKDTQWCWYTSSAGQLDSSFLFKGKPL
jgi:hypothetical protein